MLGVDDLPPDRFRKEGTMHSGMDQIKKPIAWYIKILVGFIVVTPTICGLYLGFTTELFGAPLIFVISTIIAGCLILCIVGYMLYLVGDKILE